MTNKEFVDLKTISGDLYPDITTDEEFRNIITETFLGKDYYVPTSCNQGQVNSYAIANILYNNDIKNLSIFGKIKRFFYL